MGAYVVCCFVASLVCFAAASPATLTTSVKDGSEVVNRDDETNVLRQELNELKEVVALLQHVIGHQLDTDSKQAAEAFVAQLVRKRRDLDDPLPGSLGSTNGSDPETEDPNLSRILLGYHSAYPTGGTVYTHWGRSDCPDGSDFVYTGTTTGSYYSHTGGGSNYLCMPLEPIYDEFETTSHSTRALLYSAEFETSTAPAFADLHDQTPACAVCRAPPTRLTKLMLPGRNECPSSKWRLEYKGYLMAGLYTHKARTEYICMDRDAESVPGTTGSQDGSQFYMTEARCMSGGGLPCGPYVSGYELTCAVCTI